MILKNELSRLNQEVKRLNLTNSDLQLENDDLKELSKPEIKKSNNKNEILRKENISIASVITSDIPDLRNQ